MNRRGNQSRKQMGGAGAAPPASTPPVALHALAGDLPVAGAVYRALDPVSLATLRRVHPLIAEVSHPVAYDNLSLEISIANLPRFITAHPHVAGLHLTYGPMTAYGVDVSNVFRMLNPTFLTKLKLTGRRFPFDLRPLDHLQVLIINDGSYPVRTNRLPTSLQVLKGYEFSGELTHLVNLKKICAMMLYGGGLESLPSGIEELYLSENESESPEDEIEYFDLSYLTRLHTVAIRNTNIVITALPPNIVKFVGTLPDVIDLRGHSDLKIVSPIDHPMTQKLPDDIKKVEIIVSTQAELNMVPESVNTLVVWKSADVSLNFSRFENLKTLQVLSRLENPPLDQAEINTVTVNLLHFFGTAIDLDLGRFSGLKSLSSQVVDQETLNKVTPNLQVLLTTVSDLDCSRFTTLKMLKMPTDNVANVPLSVEYLGVFTLDFDYDRFPHLRGVFRYDRTDRPVIKAPDIDGTIFYTYAMNTIGIHDEIACEEKP